MQQRGDDHVFKNHPVERYRHSRALRRGDGRLASHHPETGTNAAPPPVEQMNAKPAPTGETGAIGGMNAASGKAISAVADPAKALKSASVESADGAKIGKVSKVHVDAAGKAESIDVKVGSKTVAPPATQATFDSSKKTVVAMLTASDIKKLPASGKTPSVGAPAAPRNE